MARFSQIDEQSDFPAIIVKPPMTHYDQLSHALKTHGHSVPRQAALSAVERSDERSTRPLRHSKHGTMPTTSYQSVTSPATLGENSPTTGLDIDADQKCNLMGSLLCNIQPKRLCVRQGHTEVNDQASSFSNC
jgi:hypothetical protein